MSLHSKFLLFVLLLRGSSRGYIGEVPNHRNQSCLWYIYNILLYFIYFQAFFSIFTIFYYVQYTIKQFMVFIRKWNPRIRHNKTSYKLVCEAPKIFSVHWEKIKAKQALNVIKDTVFYTLFRNFPLRCGSRYCKLCTQWGYGS